MSCARWSSTRERTVNGRPVLSHVAGVYLILDSKTGQQYLGSAYGKEGVWGRWSEYAKTGHAGNVQLLELLAKKPTAARGFRFTLLRTLPKTLTAKEVISYETRAWCSTCRAQEKGEEDDAAGVHCWVHG